VVGWNTVNVITPVSLPAGNYWLAYLPSSNSLGFRKGQTSGVSIRYYSYAFGALPATFSTSPSSDPYYHWSFYATLNTATVSWSVSVDLSVKEFRYWWLSLWHSGRDDQRCDVALLTRLFWLLVAFDNSGRMHSNQWRK
jgi:hypothetical protein